MSLLKHKYTIVSIVVLALPSAAFLVSPSFTAGKNEVSCLGSHTAGPTLRQSPGKLDYMRPITCFERARHSKPDDRHYSSRRSARSCSRVHLKRDQLPEETLRELDAADRRVKEIEEEYWRSLDKVELAIEQKCASGLAKLKMGMLQEAAEDYTAASEISHPGSRTWPLGLVLFYTDAFDKAVDVLETDIHGFENKFEEAATDERIWQAAAMFRGARVAGGATAEGLSKIAAALPPLEIEEPIRLRKTVYELFRGNASVADVEAVVASLASEGAVDRLGQAFFADVFLGLWHDVHGRENLAEKHMLDACRSTYAQPDDLWYHTPRIHARARGWTVPE